MIFFLKMIDMRIYAFAYVDFKMEYKMRSREGRRGGEQLFMRLYIHF